MRFFSRNWVMFVDSPRARERLAKPVKTYSARHNYACFVFLILFIYVFFFILFFFIVWNIMYFLHSICKLWRCQKLKAKHPRQFPSPPPSLNSFMGLENFSCAIFDYCHFAIYHLARMFAAHPPLFACLPPSSEASTVASKSFSATFMSHTQRARTLVQIESQSKIYAIYK